MSKARAKLIEERRRQIKAMDDFINTCGDEGVQDGWFVYITGHTFPEIASDEKLYATICGYFRRIINDTEWMITNEN